MNIKKEYFLLILYSKYYFRYDATVAHSFLAVIDHNHHLHRNQARKYNNEPITTNSHSWKVVVVQEKRTTHTFLTYFPYVKMVHELELDIEHIHESKLVAPNIAQLPGPPTAVLAQQHQSRF